MKTGEELIQHEASQNENEITYKHYYWKALKWFIGNCFFGLAPLLLVWLVYGLSEGKTGKDEIFHLIHDGVVLFVCTAIMGAVWVEFLISQFRLSGTAVFVVYIFPICILTIVSLDSLLIYLKVIDSECFQLGSFTTKIIAILTFIYCTFTKADLYIQEATKFENGKK